jgi:regulatory protein
LSRFTDGPSAGSPADAGPDADPVEVARTICLTQLTVGPRSRAQLAAVLARKSVPDEAATAVLDRLTEVGLIDDAAFARAWVESRQRGRGLSRRALAHELHARGVPAPERDAALGTIDESSEADAARRLVQRKIASTRGLDPAVRSRRLAGLLARKGYPPGLTMRVVREALDIDDAATSDLGALGSEPPDEPVDDPADDLADELGPDSPTRLPGAAR